MSRFTFIHDFYRDGYNDMLAEVRELQACGQWTVELRARVARQEVSAYKALKHKFQSLDTSYWAGRVAAIKSLRTAHFSEAKHVPIELKPSSNKVVYLPLPPNADRFCNLFDCGNDAVWGVCLQQDRKPFLVVCDLCRQEWVRTQTAYSAPDGWDWGEHENALLPLPEPVGNKLVVKAGLEPESFFFPCSAMMGLGLLGLMVHVPVPFLLLQAVFVLHLTVRGKHYWQRFCKWCLKSEL